MCNLMLERKGQDTENEKAFQKEAAPLFDKISELCAKYDIQHSKMTILPGGRTYVVWDVDKSLELYKEKVKKNKEYQSNWRKNNKKI